MLQSPGFVLPLDHDLEKFLNTCSTRLTTPFLLWLYPRWGHFPSAWCGPIPAAPEPLTWTFLLTQRQWCESARQSPQSWCGNLSIGTVYFCCMCAGSLSVHVLSPTHGSRAGMGAPFGVGNRSLLPWLPEGVPWGCH